MMFDTKKELKDLERMYGKKEGKRAFVGMLKTSADYLKRNRK
jgi:hypothetical protein